MAVTGEGREGEGEVVQPLAFVMRQEAQRFLTEQELQPDPALTAAGWERRFIAEGKRAEEAMALYRELGFEVRAESLRPEEMRDECNDCELLMLLNFKTIYTRKRPR